MTVVGRPAVLGCPDAHKGSDVRQGLVVRGMYIYQEPLYRYQESLYRRTGTGRPKRRSDVREFNSVQGYQIPKVVGRPALARQGEAGSPSYMTLDFSGARFRFSEVVGRPALGRPEGAGCPRLWLWYKVPDFRSGRASGPRTSGGSRMSEALILFSDNSRAVEMWYEQNSRDVV